MGPLRLALPRKNEWKDFRVTRIYLRLTDGCRGTDCARKARDGCTASIVGTVEAHGSAVWCQTIHSTVHVTLFPSCWCVKV